MSPEISLTVLITKQAKHANQSFGLSLLLRDLKLSMLSRVCQKSSMLSNVPIILWMCVDSLGKKKWKETISPFSSSGNSSCVAVSSPAVDNNFSPLVYFLDVWTHGAQLWLLEARRDNPITESLTHLVFFLKSETPDASLLQNSKSQSLQTPGLDSSPFEPREHPAPPL